MNMSQVWAMLVGAIILLILYGIVSSKVSGANRKKEREALLLRAEGMFRTGSKYDFHLRNGKKFPAVTFIGNMIPDASDGSTGWEEMIVLQNETGKKIFVKQSTIRLVEEV